MSLKIDHNRLIYVAFQRMPEIRRKNQNGEHYNSIIIQKVIGDGLSPFVLLPVMQSQQDCSCTFLL